MTGETDLLRAALVGAHDGGAPSTDSPVDALPLASGNRERDLLLRAGAWATYRRAGYLPSFAPETPSIAPEETRPVCSEAAVAMLVNLFSNRRNDLLPEAFERLRVAGLRLPPSLLPLALDSAPAELRAAAVPALGARGIWLAQFNPSWRWAATRLAGNATPDEAQVIWEEGATSQRVEVLRRLRASEPEQARELLADVWKREKADTRVEFLATLSLNLGPADIPMLELALTDRAERVRATATDSLMALPESAFALRMRRRGEAMFTYAGGRLDVNPPADVDEAWTSDGLSAIPAKGGQRREILFETLRRVPPEHWEAQFGAAPDALLDALDDSPWRATVLLAWSAAAARFGSARWAAPLWRRWLSASSAMRAEAREGLSVVGRLLMPLLPRADVGAFALALIASPEQYSDLSLAEGLSLLPRPWSDAVADAYLASLRDFTQNLQPDATSVEPWGATLAPALVGLPYSRFPHALESFTFPTKKTWQITQFEQSLKAFAAGIRLRAHIIQEIPL